MASNGALGLDLGVAAGLLTPLPPSDEPEDIELWRNAMRALEVALRRTARWYRAASDKTTRYSRILLPPGGADGFGIKAVDANPDRVKVSLLAPSGATQLYYNTSRNFGVIDTTLLRTQYGMQLLPSTYVSFGPEYAGELWVFNAAASTGPTLDVRIEEFFADDEVV